MNKYSKVELNSVLWETENTAYSSLPTNQTLYQGVTAPQTHTLMAAVGSDLGFSILPKDSLICRPEEAGD